MLRGARRCWDGTQQTMTGENLLRELHAEDSIPDPVLDRFETVLRKEAR